MMRLWRARRNATGVCWKQLGRDDLDVLLGHIDRLTDTAAQMLAAEKDLS